MWNEPKLYGFFPEEEIFPENEPFRLPPGYLPSAQSRPLAPEDIEALSRFAQKQEPDACISFESDEFDPCVILMKRTPKNGLFLLRLRSLTEVEDRRRLSRLTDLLISLSASKKLAKDEAFFLPDASREAFCRFFGDGKDAVSSREVSLFCSTVSTLQCVLPVFEGAIDNDVPVVPEWESCRFWEYYLTCLSAMLRAAKRSEDRILRIKSGFDPRDGHFFFSFAAAGEADTARMLERIVERLRPLLPTSRYGSFLPDSGWRVETAYREGAVSLTLHAAPYVKPVMHSPHPVTLFPMYFSSLPAFAEIIGEFL